MQKGTFKQSEFAADFSRVHTGDASEEYQNPVIKLQTDFGGCKTHTMLAVYHLVKGETPLSELQGIPPIIDKAGITSLPKAKVVVIDGN